MIYIRKVILCKRSTEQTRKLQQEKKKKTGKIHKRKPNNRLIIKEKES